MASVKDMDLDWSIQSEGAIFYIFNRQKCTNNADLKDEDLKGLDIVWGLVFLLLGIGIIGLNILAGYGLHKSCRNVRDIFRHTLYGNISVLNIASGLCAILSGGVMLSHFTWNEADKAGEFVSNVFGMLFILTIQTKLMLITGGLLACVFTSVAKLKLSGRVSKMVTAIIIVISWLLGLIQVLLPYFFNSQYAHPDYMTIPVASYGEMQLVDIDKYYSGQLVLLFAPLFLGILLIFFTIPGLSVPRAPQKIYNWGDEEFGTFTFTTLLVSFLLCHSIYFIIHFAGFWAIDDMVLFNLCSLSIQQLRYFLAFIVFVSYISGVAEPLIYLTTNIETRNELAGLLPFMAAPPESNRVTPLLMDINRSPPPTTTNNKPSEDNSGAAVDIERADSAVDIEEPTPRDESRL